MRVRAQNEALSRVGCGRAVRALLGYCTVFLLKNHRVFGGMQERSAAQQVLHEGGRETPETGRVMSSAPVLSR